ncbi:ndt80 like dna-binding family protein [Rutstroemia sp. NJR-2017a BVV2]|nr:ndt80 like dna-binding family protein [Rutstroemia sp. NJR-2017a BVV2]
MSQAGNISDLAAYSGHSSLSVVGSEPEPDSSSRQEFAHHPPLPSDMGMRYMTLSATDDVRSDSGTSHSPGFSIDHQNPSSNQPNISFSPYPHSYQSTLSGPTYSGGSNPYFSPSPSVYSMPDIKPRLNSIHSSTGMAPPSRSPALPHPTSPISTRDLYAGGTPHLRRTDGVSRSPSTSGTVRGVPLSPSSSGFASPTNMEGTQLGGQLTPPLNATEVINNLQASDGQIITPEIFAKIDKGFFMAESDWTCYRRNYFSLSCSFMLQPVNPNGPIHLILPGSQQRPLISGFAMSIAAVVDARDGKAIELVQHTPKRDKGPQEKPPRVNLSPRPHAQHNMYSNDNGLGGGRSMYDGTFAQPPNQQNIEATFERIQFKNATANNGKRRAAQQYYHLLVELFANIGQGPQEQWVKIAVRMSAPMVVRGRSPGHYQSERRGSNASSGPGGAGGAGGGGSYTTSGGTSRTPGDINMSGTSSMLPGPGYSSTYDGRSHHYRSAPLQIPMEPTLSAEDAKGIENSNCYLYYPAPIWEGSEPRNQLPSLPEYVPGKIKQEYNSGGAYSLPSITGAQDTLGRHCGRWEGVPKSVGYFPTTALAQELNIS